MYYTYVLELMSLPAMQPENLILQRGDPGARTMGLCSLTGAAGAVPAAAREASHPVATMTAIMSFFSVLTYSPCHRPRESPHAACCGSVL